MNILVRIFGIGILGILSMLLIIGASSLDQGGGWLCTPIFIIFLLGMFQPWKWTREGIKQGLRLILVISVFGLFLLMLIAPIYAIVIFCIYEKWLEIIAMLVIMAIGGFGINWMIDKGLLSEKR